MIHLDGETVTLAAFAKRCVRRKMSNAQALAALGAASIDPHALANAMAQARRVERGGALLQSNGWTDARVARLRELWADGLSASRVAAEIGGGITRNAVIGKVHRLGIVMRAKAAPRPKRIVAPPGVKPAKRIFDPRKPVADRAEPFPAPEPIAPALVVVEDMSAPRVLLADLRDDMCKWPIGEPASVEFRFCGAKAAAGYPYCGYHAQIAYQPSNDRRRARDRDRAKGTSGYASARRLSCAESYRW